MVGGCALVKPGVSSHTEGSVLETEHLKLI
jgi:hypothetical protein